MAAEKNAKRPEVKDFCWYTVINSSEFSKPMKLPHKEKRDRKIKKKKA